MHNPHIWSQSVARRALMGGERTHNPSPAASALLLRKFGKRRVKRAVSFLGKRRRSFHRGNPLPAAIALATKIPGLGGLLKTPSEKRAAKIVGAVVASAVSGNLTAAKAIDERTSIGIVKERAVWRAAWAQVPKKIKDLLKKYAELVPGVDHTSPETAADSALSRAVDANELEAAAREEGRMSKAERAAAAREERAARGVTQGRLTELGVAGLQALAGRGRRLSGTRRRRRRSTGRSIRF
jgi:hypothetical protein